MTPPTPIGDLRVALESVRGDTREILARMAAADERHSVHAEATGRAITDHEARIRALEHSRALIIGAATVVGGAAGALARFL